MASGSTARVGASSGFNGSDLLTSQRDVPATKDRIAGTPFWFSCVKWSEDGKVAVVSENNVQISSFLAKELDLYMEQIPIVSKNFIFLTELPSPDASSSNDATTTASTSTSRTSAPEHFPLQLPVFPDPFQTFPKGASGCFLLHDNDRIAPNPKEISLSKNGGNVFVAVTWGPRGSAPKHACALLTLTASGRIALHFAAKFRLHWRQMDVFSENLYAFLERHQFRLGDQEDPDKDMHPEPETEQDGAANKRRRRTETTKSTTTKAASASLGTNEETLSVQEFQTRSNLLVTLSVAWSPFVSVGSKKTSVLAFSGRQATTLWAYNYCDQEMDEDTNHADADTGSATTSLLASRPFGWINTKEYGWVTSSTWQRQASTLEEHSSALRIALGTTFGRVLIASIPVQSINTDPGEVQQLPVLYAFSTQFHQPIVDLCYLACSELIVASGSRVSVWSVNPVDVTTDEPVTTQEACDPLRIWRAHSRTITALAVDIFENWVFTSSCDGLVKTWLRSTGDLINEQSCSPDENLCSTTNTLTTLSTHRVPVYGLSVSPNGMQLAAISVIPPAARPNRRVQADISYSRVSCFVEYLPTPTTSSPSILIPFVEKLLATRTKKGGPLDLNDVVWFCHIENLQFKKREAAASNMLVVNLLNKLEKTMNSKSGTSAVANSAGAADQDAKRTHPLYVALADHFEAQFLASTSQPPGSNLQEWPISFLQVSFLLRSSILTLEGTIGDVKPQEEARCGQVEKALWVFWSLRGLSELSTSTRQLVDLTEEEQTSALQMADLLWMEMQTRSSSSASEEASNSAERFFGMSDDTVMALLQPVYMHIGTEEDRANWVRFQQDPSSSLMNKWPSRETCFVCESPVLFRNSSSSNNKEDGEKGSSSKAAPALCCTSGHLQQRCFVSFRCISSVDSLKCLGCGACARKEVSCHRNAFYLFQATSTDNMTGNQSTTITCRLCGSLCSYLAY